MRNVIYFLRSDLKFFGLLALGLSVIAVTLVLLVPKQCEKQTDLSVRQVPSELAVQLRQQPSEVGVKRAPANKLGKAAVRYAQEGDFGGVNVSPRYDTVEQQVRLAFSSRDRGSLEEVGSEALDLLKDRFQEFFEGLLGPTLEARLTALERSLRKDEEVLAQIEQQIEQSSSTEAVRAENAGATARLEELEAQRARVLGDIASAELEIRDLEQAQSELARCAAEAVSIEVANESGVQQSSSSARRIALAVLSALVVAATLTVVWGRSGRSLAHDSRWVWHRPPGLTHLV